MQQIGIDVGGTFTDLVVADGTTGIHTLKVLSTPDDYSRGVLDGVGAAECWGDPLDRDARLVAEDVRDGKVSAAAAASEYGVCVNQAGGELDLAATLHRRAQIRSGRVERREAQ